MKLSARIIQTSLGFILLAASCVSHNDSPNQEPTRIDWDDLQIPPKPIEDLCSAVTREEIDTWENVKNDFTYGLAGGFLPEDLSIPKKMAYDTYWVNSDEQLTFDWLFWYPEGNDESATLRLFVLLDEQQLDKALPEPGAFNDINLEKGDDKSIKVVVPPLSAGVHDLIAVGIPYPENEPDEYGSVIVIYRRITLIALPANSPFREIEFTSLPLEGSLKRNDPGMGLELTLQKGGVDVWNWPNSWLDVNENNAINFFVLAGHQDVINEDAPSLDELKTSFASLLLFVDYQQVEIAPNQIVVYGKTDQDTAYARIPVTISPLSRGKHHILVLRIDTPGIPICILRGDSNSRILPNSVYGKLVGVNVVP
ncbi:MAG: hypothetical protein QY302_13655 [Anaerolineales bacterium]|nr:MAG: hypothetical protein QY302_13655 [Anaerolineales bacterium]